MQQALDHQARGPADPGVGRADPFGGADPGKPRRRAWLMPAAVVAAGALIWIGAFALALRALALPGDASGTVFVVFPPATGDAQAFEAIVAAGGNPVRPTLAGFTWIAADDDPGFVARLEDQGALAAFADAPIGISLAGCFGFIPAADRPRPAPPLQPL